MRKIFCLFLLDSCALENRNCASKYGCNLPGGVVT